MNKSFEILDLPYLQDATFDCVKGGYADAGTGAYADTGFAIAGAFAVAEGHIAITKTRTKTMVRVTPAVIISKAFAFGRAFSRTGNQVDVDVSVSRFVDVSRV